MSDGGALVHTAESVALGQIRQYYFSTPSAPDGARFAARVVHVMRVSAAERATYVVGLEFDPPLDAASKEALRKVTGG